MRLLWSQTLPVSPRAYVLASADSASLEYAHPQGLQCVHLSGVHNLQRLPVSYCTPLYAVSV